MPDPILEAILDDSRETVNTAIRESRGRIRRRRRALAASAVLLTLMLPIALWWPRVSMDPVANPPAGIAQFSTADISSSLVEFRSEPLENRISLFTNAQVERTFREIDEPALLDLLSDYRPVIVRLGDRPRLLLLQEPL